MRLHRDADGSWYNRALTLRPSRPGCRSARRSALRLHPLFVLRFVAQSSLEILKGAAVLHLCRAERTDEDENDKGIRTRQTVPVEHYGEVIGICRQDVRCSRATARG